MARRWGQAMAAAALGLATAAGASAAAPERTDEGCSVTYNADDPMTELIRREKFADSYFQTLCPWLAANGLEVSITNDAGRIDERPFAWVSVRIMRAANQITGPRTSSSTVLPGGSETPETALRQALDRAMTGLAEERDQHLRELVAREAEARPRR